MKKNNEIHRLDDNIRTERKSYKPIFIIIVALLIIVILGLIIFKDSFKLNSIDTFEESTELLYDKKIKTNFDSIVINSDFSNIEIHENNEDYVDITIYGESAKEKIYEDNNKLNINLKLTCTICHKVKSGKIVLNIPGDLIKNLDINVKYGSLQLGMFNNTNINADIEYGNFSAEYLNKLDLKLLSGNVKMSAVNSINANIDVGNVTINSISEYADLYTNLGNIIVTNLEPSKESKLETNNGSVVIVNASEYYYNAKSKNGIIKLPDNNDNYKDNIKINITTDTGNITVGE